jgi:hypothetical protein
MTAAIGRGASAGRAAPRLHSPRSLGAASPAQSHKARPGSIWAAFFVHSPRGQFRASGRRREPSQTRRPSRLKVPDRGECSNSRSPPFVTAVSITARRASYRIVLGPRQPCEMRIIGSTAGVHRCFRRHSGPGRRWPNTWRSSSGSRSWPPSAAGRRSPCRPTDRPRLRASRP